MGYPSSEDWTVIFESVSHTRFREDGKGDILVKEIHVRELKNIGGEWKLVAAEFSMDPRPVLQRAMELRESKARDVSAINVH
jgi:hypothetical protein